MLQALRLSRRRFADEMECGKPEATGPCSSSIEFSFTKKGKEIRIVDNLVVMRKSVTQITRRRTVIGDVPTAVPLGLVAELPPRVQEAAGAGRRGGGGLLVRWWWQWRWQQVRAEHLLLIIYSHY